MIDDEELFEQIAKSMPFISTLYAQFTRKFWEMALDPSRQDVFAMLERACDMLAKRIDLGQGYRMSVLGAFNYQEVAFSGYHLTILNPEGKSVGALGFKIGLPFEITTIQGQNNQEPLKFSLAIGTSFDRALVDRFIFCVGSNVHFPFGHPLKDEHKAVLNLEHSIANKQMEKRIYDRYFPRSAVIRRTQSQTITRANMLYVKEKHFAHAWRQAQAVAR